jgi:aspartate racemase
LLLQSPNDYPTQMCLLPGRIEPMPDHIGIVACSAEGASLCYLTICKDSEQHLGTYGHPEFTMHTHSFAQYMQCIEADDWMGVGELMLSSANNLAKIGANFLIRPDNTIHQALPLIASRSPLPWLHIAEVVATEAVERCYQCIGIVGTRLAGR